MRKIVLTFGLLAGAMLSAMMLLTVGPVFKLIQQYYPVVV